MKNRRKRNYLIILSIVLIFLFLTIGYASLQQLLTISGTSGVGNASWDINFISITKNTTLSTNGVVESSTPGVNGTSATFSVELKYPSAKIVYDIIVENEGTIDATFANISGIEEINEALPVEIQYTVQRLDPDTDEVLTGTEDLNIGAQHKFRVIIEWVSVPNSTVPTTVSKTGTININYLQKTT